MKCSVVVGHLSIIIGRVHGDRSFETDGTYEDSPFLLFMTGCCDSIVKRNVCVESDMMMLANGNNESLGQEG
jgi:hypothetical protein